MRNIVKLVLTSTLILSFNAFAQDEAAEPDYGWSGTGELGIVSTTGNTKSFAGNLKFELIKTTETWRHRFGGTALYTSEDDVQDNERYTAELQSDRKLNEKSWVFGSYRYDADKFGSYDPSQTLTVGYGRDLMKSENHHLKGEIGGGYRSLKERLTGVKESDAIARFLLDDTWQVWSTTVWTNRLLVETGKNNTFTQFNTALAVSMTERFAVKLGFEVRNNSKVPPGDTKKTDTVTTVNLVYGF